MDQAHSLMKEDPYKRGLDLSVISLTLLDFTKRRSTGEVRVEIAPKAKRPYLTPGVASLHVKSLISV